MNIQPSIDLKKVNLQTAVGYLVSLHENEYQWNLLGIKVVGVAATEADIPEGTYEYGDAYEVGTEPPYDMYIYTRPDGVVHTEGYWFNTGKFPMPGPQGPKGDGLDQISKWTNGTVSNVTYDATDGAKVKQTSTLEYKDSTDGSTKYKSFDTTTTLPIIPGKYISMNTTSDNKKMEVKVDDTELALDYIKITKIGQSVLPRLIDGVVYWTYATNSVLKNAIAMRDDNGDCSFNKIYVDRLATKTGEYDMPLQAVYYGGWSDGYIVEKTPTDTGTLTISVMNAINTYPNIRVKYDNQVYYRMDPASTPNGTLNFIHLDSIEDGNGGHKATGKCFSVTVSTRAWQVVDLDFGGQTTHNLTLTNSSTGTRIYFSLTNNRPETYEGAPAGLWSALENSPIACTVNISGIYSAGMITTEGDNFKVFYGNSEEMTITQTEMAITDNII